MKAVLKAAAKARQNPNSNTMRGVIKEAANLRTGKSKGGTVKRGRR